MDIIPMSDQACCKQVEPETCIKMLNARKATLELRLKEVNDAIEFIEKNPEFVDFIDRFNKVRRGI